MQKDNGKRNGGQMKGEVVDGEGRDITDGQEEVSSLRGGGKVQWVTMEIQVLVKGQDKCMHKEGGRREFTGTIIMCGKYVWIKEFGQRIWGIYQ